MQRFAQIDMLMFPASEAPYFATFAVWAPCFLKVRVGENSPSLCPTIFSVTNTELKIFPLCTRKVWPTKSGVIIERRDQVLIGFFATPLLIFSIFSTSFTSTNGPFFSDLLIPLFSLFPALPMFDDNRVTRLMFAASFEAFSQLAPWADWVMSTATTLTLALTTAHRVINR